MIRSEIRRRILYLLNEDPDDPVFYTTARANAAIQEAMELIAEEITTLRRQAFIVTEPGRHWYTTYEISHACMTPFRIWSDGTGQRLEPIVMSQLEDVYVKWINVTTDHPQWWYPISFDAFGIWPGPQAGGTVLRVDYLAWPDTQDGDNEEIEAREIEQDLIILHGEYDGLIRQWEVERAMDIFSKFVGNYMDSKYKSETRRYHYMMMNRSQRGEGSVDI